jgi:hypothetical protein
VYIELTPELEKAVLAEAESTGLSPTEIAHRALAAHTAGAKLSPREAPVSSIQPETLVDPETMARRKAAVERIRAMQTNGGSALGPPPGVRWREWIHQGHKY